MLIVIGTARFDPAHIAALRPAAAAMMKATQAEAGCIAYHFAEDLAEPGLVHIVERWESQAALDAHIKAPHGKVFNEALAATPPKAFHVKVYDGTGERVLFARG